MLKENFIDMFKNFHDWEENYKYKVYNFNDEEETPFYDIWSDQKYKYAWYDAITKKEWDEDEVRRRYNEINWKFVCRWIDLSESFIREFRDYVDWKLIKKHQKVSKDFLIEMGKKRK